MSKEMKKFIFFGIVTLLGFIIALVIPDLLTELGAWFFFLLFVWMAYLVTKKIK